MVAQQSESSSVSALFRRKCALAILGDRIESKTLNALEEKSFEIIVVGDRVIDLVSIADVAILLAQSSTAVSLARQIKDTPIIWIAPSLQREDLARAIASGIKGILNDPDNLTPAIETVKRGAHFFDCGIVSTKNLDFCVLTSSDRQKKRWATLLARHTVETWIERRALQVSNEKILQDMGLSQSVLIRELEAVDNSRSQLNNLEELVKNLQSKFNSYSSAWEVSERARKILLSWLLQDSKPVRNESDRTIQDLTGYSCKTSIEFRCVSLIKKIEAKLVTHLRLWQINGTQSQRQDLFELIESSKILAYRYQRKLENISQKRREAYENYSDLLEDLRAASKINIELQQALWEKLHNVFILKVKELSYQYACKTVNFFQEQLKLYAEQAKKNDLFLKTVRDSLSLKLNGDDRLSFLGLAYLQDKFSIQEVEKNLERFFENQSSSEIEENNCVQILEHLLLEYFQQQMEQIDSSCRQEIL
jgi:hypothetical protein